MAPGVIPKVPQQAFGRVNKSGTTAAPVAGAVGITGAASGGPGVICLDLAFVPVSGSATVIEGGGPNRPGATAELTIGTEAGCTAPYTDAAVSTRARPTRRLRPSHSTSRSTATSTPGSSPADTPPARGCGLGRGHGRQGPCCRGGGGGGSGPRPAVEGDDN